MNPGEVPVFWTRELRTIDIIVAQGVTVDLESPVVLQLELGIVGQLVDIDSTIRLTLEIKLDHGPVWTTCPENSGIRSSHIT
jgi:hypothetical protein